MDILCLEELNYLHNRVYDAGIKKQNTIGRNMQTLGQGLQKTKEAMASLNQMIQLDSLRSKEKEKAKMPINLNDDIPIKLAPEKRPRSVVPIEKDQIRLMKLSSKTPTR